MPSEDPRPHYERKFHTRAICVEALTEALESQGYVIVPFSRIYRRIARKPKKETDA